MPAWEVSTRTFVLEGKAPATLESEISVHSTVMSTIKLCAKCYICSISWEHLAGSHDPPAELVALLQGKQLPDKKCHFNYILYQDSDCEQGDVFRFDIIPQDEDGAWRISFCLVPLSTGITEDYFSGKISVVRAPSTTGAEEALSLAYSWYLSCSSQHSQCLIPSSSKKGWLPTRLLDIGTQDTGIWKLIETGNKWSSSSETPPYLTLSYRWGTKPQRLLLRTTNIKDFVQGLSSRDLAMTFRDFETVARRFGIRYLWIDALCIIQDSESGEDWRREAPLMRYVYANSACNIAATASEDPEGGLFRHRDPNDISTGIIKSQDSGSEQERDYWIFDKSFWNRKLFQGPLHRRGWVLQERLLAPRVLYFTKDELFWECLSDAKCESFPHGTPHHLPFKHLNILWGLLDAKMKVGSGGYKEEILGSDVTMMRNSIVKNYMRCLLTKESDRLPALAGIATLFHQATGDEYIAGLWKFRLLEQLDWRVYSPAKLASSEYRAPSWSWASVDGPARPIGEAPDTETPLEVVEAASSYNTLFGEVSSAHLKLRGFLMMGQVERHVQSERLTPQLQVRIGECSHNGEFFRDRLDVMPAEGHSVWVLPLKTHGEETEEGMTCALVCMVLEAVLCAASPTFRRVGMFLPLDTDHECGQEMCLGLNDDGTLAQDWDRSSWEFTLI
ncbi:unnamed protein product [Clonostachys rosea]|uniref:Heterokaryon incompatibility domain-containing protein n=1 Tax=Bionectria ochroleuca TaxID=29856 RepID=A0ABY6U0I0_BIOOC|nr:unnamed protein product [Clonostachys rosea]